MTETAESTGPVRGSEEYTLLLERRIKAQRDQLDAMNQTRVNGNISARKKIAYLERLLGQREIKLARQYDGLQSLKEKEKVYKEALREIETYAFRQYLTWMHFHELAMAKPFDAEAEAQEFAQRISSLATIALGVESGIEVIGGEL